MSRDKEKTMEENTQIEQSLDLDEEQLQAINGGVGSEETLKAIAHHQAQASSWSDVHAQKLREGSPEFAQAALSLAAEHANIAEGLQKSHEQFQQLVASTPPKPKSNLLNCFGCFR
jgi:hypothetical protein